METSAVSQEPPDSLRDVLERSRRFGFLGPGPIEFHVKHSLGFSDVWDGSGPPERALDLGSGGGVPGLVLATMRWPATRWTLMDAAQRRCDFLREAIGALGVTDRVRVHQGRAEEAGRAEELRHAMTLVVARSFGPPAVTAECAAPLLAPGGRLVVSDPPEAPQHGRWPEAGLAELGLRRLEPGSRTEHRFSIFVQERPCGERYPRPVGRPAKRPLF